MTERRIEALVVHQVVASLHLLLIRLIDHPLWNGWGRSDELGHRGRWHLDNVPSAAVEMSFGRLLPASFVYVTHLRLRCQVLRLGPCSFDVELNRLLPLLLTVDCELLLARRFRGAGSAVSNAVIVRFSLIRQCFLSQLSSADMVLSL